MILTSWYSLVKKELYQNVLRIVSETAKGIEKKKKMSQVVTPCVVLGTARI